MYYSKLVLEGLGFSNFSGPYNLRLDVDSFYVLLDSLEGCSSAFGKGVTFTVDSVKKHTDSTASSRFSLDLIDSDSMRIGVAGFNPKKVGLNYMSNIKLFDVKIPPLTPRCQIFLYFLNTTRSSKTPYISHLQLKATAVVLNAARLDLIHNLELWGDSPLILEGICGMHGFECMVKGTQRRLLKNRKSTLLYDQAQAFFRQIDETLLLFEEMDYAVILERIYYKLAGHHDMDWDNREGAYKDLFLQLRNMRKSVAFSMSCAGFKADFHRFPELQRELVWEEGPDCQVHNLMEMNTAIQLLKARLLGILLRFLLIDPHQLNEPTPSIDLPFKFNMDIGIKISPVAKSGVSLLLRGKRAKKVGEYLLRMCLPPEMVNESASQPPEDMSTDISDVLPETDNEEESDRTDAVSDNSEGTRRGTDSHLSPAESPANETDPTDNERVSDRTLTVPESSDGVRTGTGSHPPSAETSNGTSSGLNTGSSDQNPPATDGSTSYWDSGYALSDASTSSSEGFAELDSYDSIDANTIVDMGGHNNAGGPSAVPSMVSVISRDISNPHVCPNDVELSAEDMEYIDAGIRDLRLYGTERDGGTVAGSIASRGNLTVTGAPNGKFNSQVH